MEWIKYSKYNMPPQGLKILCFKKGDLWVARRFEYKGNNYWIEIPFAEGTTISTPEPDYWLQVQLPEGYTGYMKMKVGDAKGLMTMDETMKKYPESHEQVVSMFIPTLKNILPPQPLD